MSRRHRRRLIRRHKHRPNNWPNSWPSNPLRNGLQNAYHCNGSAGEVAANGFVDQLQRVTGLDYRVVKVKPGVYEVAFAYEDDQEITANLTQISAATGLQLPES